VFTHTKQTVLELMLLHFEFEVTGYFALQKKKCVRASC